MLGRLRNPASLPKEGIGLQNHLQKRVSQRDPTTFAIEVIREVDATEKEFERALRESYKVPG